MSQDGNKLPFPGEVDNEYFAKGNPAATTAVGEEVCTLNQALDCLQRQQHDALHTSMSLDPELEKLKIKHLTDSTNLGDFDASLYVPTRGMTQPGAPEKDHFDLYERIQEFGAQEAPHQRICLIQGAAGSGKSTFNHYFARQLWAQYDDELSKGQSPSRIPVFISLATLHDANKHNDDLIVRFFREQNWTETQIKEAQDNLGFVFILDGYDEIARQDCNFYLDNKIGNWNAKMVITSRPECLNQGYQSNFYPSYGHQQQYLQEYWIAPFTTQSINQYITQYVARSSITNSVDYYQSLVSRPDVQTLISNPFLLCMMMSIQPTSGKEASSSETPVVPAKRVTLYEKFLDHWFSQAQTYLNAIQLSPVQHESFVHLCEEGFPSHVQLFCQKFALELYRHQALNATYIPTAPGPSIWTQFLRNENVATQLKRFSSPLSRNQYSYRFLQKSIRDFLVAQSLWQDTTDRLLNEFRIVDDPGVIDFVVEYAQNNSELQKRLMACVKRSIEDATIAQAAANAITILVRAGAQFDGSDLRGIRIPGADLSSGWFNHAQMQGADLGQARLQGIWLRGADLSGAHMENASFGEKPHVRVKGCIMAIGYSSTAELLAAGVQCKGDNVLCIWSVAGLLHHFHGHASEIRAAAISPNGVYLASGGSDRTVRLWSITDGTIVHIFEGHADNVECVNFSPDSRLLLSGDKHGLTRVWSVANQNLLGTYGSGLGTLESGLWVQWAMVSADSQLLASCVLEDGGFGIHLWSVGDCTTAELGVLKVPYLERNAIFACAAFSPRDRLLVVGDSGRGLSLWSWVEKELIPMQSNKTAGEQWKCAPCKMTFSQDGQLIAVASLDLTLQIWSMCGQQMHLVYEFNDMNSEGGPELLFSPDGHLINISSDSQIRQCEIPLPARHNLDNFGRGKDQVEIWKEVTISSREPLATFLDFNDTTQLLLPDSFSIHDTFVSNAGTSEISISPACTMLVCANVDLQTLQCWSIQTGECIFDWKTDQGGFVYNFSVSPDDKMVEITTRPSYTIQLWSIETGLCIQRFEGHSGLILSCAYSPDCKTFASGSFDGTVRLWSVETGECLHCLGDTGVVEGISFSHGGIVLGLSSRDDKTVCLWSVKSGECLGCFEGHTDWVRSIAFSPNDTLVASASDDNTVRLWETASGHCVYIYEGHTREVTTIAFSIDGDFIVSGSKDCTMRIWSVQNKNMVLQIDLQRMVSLASWGGVNGRERIVVSGDGFVQLWCLNRCLGQGTENDSIDLICKWSSKRGLLHLDRVRIQGVTGLSQENKMLLEQRGATGEPAGERVIEVPE